MPWQNQSVRDAFTASANSQLGLTSGEKTTLTTAIESISIAPVIFGNLICDGDSLTAGVSVQTPYPTLLQSQLGASWRVTNLGTGGDQLAQILSGGPAVDAVKDTAATINACVIWGGTNDLYWQRTPTQIYTDIVAYCAARRAVGFKIVVVPVISRYQTVLPVNFEASRQSLNAMIRANWRTFADAICDFEMDVRFANAQTSPLFADQVHLNTSGNTVVADYVASSVLGLLP